MSVNSPNVNWEAELTRTSWKYHLIVCWVAIILNPVWAIGDYYNIPDYWLIFLNIRIIVSLATFLGFIYRKKMRTEFTALIPFLGIALQNAYMYSVMDVETLRKHTLAYIALFIGAGMLVLWKRVYSLVVVFTSLLANIICFYFFSPLKIDEVLINGGLLTATTAIFTILLIQTRFNLTKREIISRLALAESNETLAWQKMVIEEKNRDITSSIQYAKQIQQAIFPSRDQLTGIFPDSFIFLQPKDIVSGDFYWFSKKENDILIAAADCTGHGVPGALMSMIGTSFLNEIVNEKNVHQTDEILFLLRESIIKSLAKGRDGKGTKDGMDIALCHVQLHEMKLEYSGAFNPLWVIRNSELTELPGNKFPVGTFMGEENDNKFTKHEFRLEKGDSVYLFTDGYADQFGGKDGKKFKYKAMLNLLLSVQNKTMDEQRTIIADTFNTWKGELEQVDDILVLGFRI